MRLKYKSIRYKSITYKSIKYKSIAYVAFHIFVHFLLTLAIAYFSSLDYTGYILAIFATFIIDLDHLPLLMRYGIGGTFFLRIVVEFGKPRKYPLHNIYIIALTGIISFIFFNFKFYFLGAITLGAITFVIFIHLLWDLFEDATVFKMGVKHWL